MRCILPIIAAVGLVACAPNVPDSGAGVGFKDYETYLAEQRARDQALRTGQPMAVQLPATSVNPASPPVVVVQTTPAQQTASAAVAAVRGENPVVVETTSARAVPAPSATAPTSQVAAVPQADNPDLSDEQDFGAVSQRQTIQSDAERRRAQSAQYQVVAPTALPKRPRKGAQTPIEFAVATSHPVGQRVYGRSPFSSNKSARACAKYASKDRAQDAFLKAGGPKRDKLGVDPDGDGYACGWDPSVYRSAASN